MITHTNRKDKPCLSITNLNLILRCDASVDSFIGVFTISYINRQVVEKTIKQVGRTQMGRVNEIVGALRMLLQPRTIIGSMVQDNVADAERLLQKLDNFCIKFCCLKPVKITFHSLRILLTNLATSSIEYSRPSS